MFLFFKNVSHFSKMCPFSHLSPFSKCFPFSKCGPFSKMCPFFKTPPFSKLSPIGPCWALGPYWALMSPKSEFVSKAFQVLSLSASRVPDSTPRRIPPFGSRDTLPHVWRLQGWNATCRPAKLRQRVAKGAATCHGKLNEAIGDPQLGK